ncbi:hypothetical protein Bbelb_219280 [Branchiostoma belcheri]|nr:hypothetical protein Bbelb_219280 [Branchiostoma belcheri]
MSEALTKPYYIKHQGLTASGFQQPFYWSGLFYGIHSNGGYLHAISVPGQCVSICHPADTDSGERPITASPRALGTTGSVVKHMQLLVGYRQSALQFGQEFLASQQELRYTAVFIVWMLTHFEEQGGQYNDRNSGPISNGVSGDVTGIGTLLTNHDLEFQTCVEAICDCEDFYDVGKCIVRKLAQKAEELDSSDTRISACLERPVPNRINITGYKLDCHVFGLRDFTFSVNVALTGRNCTQRSGLCYTATLSQRPCTLYVKRGMDVGDRTPPSPIITGIGVLLVGSIITAVLCSCDRTEQDDVYVFDAELSKFTLAKNIA